MEGGTRVKREPEYQSDDRVGIIASNASPTGHVRLASLDVLRAFAVILVMGRHMHVPPPGTHPLVARVATFLESFGQTGVDLFFVLSGFLVSGLLFREYVNRGTVRVRRFYVRRALKIYPAFYVYIAVVITMAAVQHHHGVSRTLGKSFSAGHVTGELLFLQNYLGNLQPHTWTLAVEEHFYILIGLWIAVIIARARGARRADPFRTLVPGIIACTLCVIALRYWTARSVPYSVEAYIYPTHLRADSLLFGVLLAYFHWFHRDRTAAWTSRWRWAILLASGGFLVAPFVAGDGPVAYALGYTSLYLGFGALVLLSVQWDGLGNALARTRLARIGAYSYSIYLWHQVTLSATTALLGNRHWELRMGLYLLTAIGFGILMARLVELPVLRIRDKYFPSNAPTGGSGTTPIMAARRSTRRTVSSAV